MDYDRRRRRNNNPSGPPRPILQDQQDQQNNGLPVPQHQLGQYQLNGPNQIPLQQPNIIDNQLQQRMDNDLQLIQVLSNDGYVEWSGYRVWLGVDPSQVGEQSLQEGKGRTAVRHRQGWKLHVTVNPDQTVPLMQAIKPLLQNLNVAHKFSDGYAENPGRYSGKFVTIYLDNWMNDLANVIATIEPVVSQFQGGQMAQGEFPLGKTNQISTRYGSFTHERYIQNPEGKSEIDSRARTAPEWKQEDLNVIQTWNEWYKK